MLRSVAKMTENVAKRLKPNPPPPSASPFPQLSIGTHNGHFHADEALAVSMLRRLPAYRSALLVRTRDPAALAACHTVVDVGGEYDPARHRYDHHQRGFTTTFPGRPTKLSSAGLVFMHFGRAIIAQELAAAAAAAPQGGDDAEQATPSAAQAKVVVSEDSPEVTLIWRRLYEGFIEALDGHDNGISAYDSAALEAASITRQYSEAGFGLGAMVGRFNGNWNDPVEPDPVAASRLEDSRFEAASARIGHEFARELAFMVTAWLPARQVVARAYADRLKHEPSGRVLVFEGGGLPWKEHLYNLEEEEKEAAATAAAAEGASSEVLYVLYPERHGDPAAKWRIQAVPVSRDSFISRKPLPEAWRGFRDDELDRITGVEGCVFVHASGFIGGNKTFDGAKRLAAMALAS